MKDLSDAQKLDILLSFKAKGYNLQDTEDPATMKMSLGTGYTLLASINKSWFIEFNDGVETTKHHIESSKIPYTNARDARTLCKKYNDECKKVLAEKRGEPVPEQKEPEPVKAPEEVETPEKRELTAEEKYMESLVIEQKKKEQEEKARLEREENERKLAEIEAELLRREEAKAAKAEVSPKKEQWKTATKQPSRKQDGAIIDAKFEEVDPGVLPTLPAPVGIAGIVRPAVSAMEALAAWREFQELKKYIIEPSDVQTITTWDKKTGKEKKSNFVKKSGWRKFATFYNLTDRIVEETKEPIAAGGFLWKIKVVCAAPNGRETEGVGMCASTERGFAHPDHDIYATAHTRAKNRAISDMIAAGEVSAEEIMDGGMA